MTQEAARDGATPAGAKLPPRERILKAADDLFERYGIRGVGVEAIAEAADTNKMTLYRHFASKDELVAEWLKSIIGEWNDQWDRLENDPPRGDARAQIASFLDEFGCCFERFADRGCAIMNTLAELPEKDHPARLVIDDYKASSRKRLIRFLRSIGAANPAQTAEDFQLLLDGAKAGIQDHGPAASRARFIKLAKALLESRLEEG